jgi:aldose 1-epimerase
MTPSGQQFVIAAGDLEAIVTEVGATLRSFTVGGIDVTVPYPQDALAPRCVGTVLVPWPNRLRGGRYLFEGETMQVAVSEPDRGNAIHGFGRWSRWTPVLHEPSRVTLAFDIPPQKGYPFEVLVEVTYALHPELGLSLSVSATNHGGRAAPFGVGWHPYLSTRGTTLDAMTVRLPASQRLLLDDGGIPIGAQSVAKSPFDLRRGRKLNGLRMDDAFTSLKLDDRHAHAEVRAGKAGGARVWCDETFRYLQVFTAENVINGKSGVAVEPMTCAPDAFNSTAGLIVLQPGGTWAGSCGIAPI